MSDPFDTEFFNAIDRVSKSPTSFSGMLEYFMVHKPKKWLSLVELLMKISNREDSNAHVLRMKLEEMIDDYAEYMDSEPKV